eukprot:SAG22_NODE_12144_length_454_cov_2.030986_1_plen_79_part_10
MTGWLVYRYKLLYMHYPIHESGGSLWPLLGDCTFVALLISHCTTFGLLSLKRASFLQLLLLGLLPAGSVVLYYTYVPLM